jgi:hypothetical protein
LDRNFKCQMDGGPEDQWVPVPAIRSELVGETDQERAAIALVVDDVLFGSALRIVHEWLIRQVQCLGSDVQTIQGTGGETIADLCVNYAFRVGLTEVPTCRNTNAERCRQLIRVSKPDFSK